MKHRRVKITGIGPVTPAGIGREAFSRGIFEPVSRIGAMTLGVGDKRSFVAAAEVRDFRSDAFALDAEKQQSSRQIQFALAATLLALRDAGLTLADVKKRKPLVVLACLAVERVTLTGAEKSDSKVSEASLLMRDAVANLVGARQETADRTVFNSSLEAIGFAASRVARGETELALCGGAEAPLNERILAELKILGLSPGHAEDPERLCRPFDLWRTTGVVGEGACVLVLEPEESPRSAYAWVAGSAAARERGDLYWETLGEALRIALGNARLRPADIDCIYADGVGSKTLDLAEAKALRAALGSLLASIPVVSIKGAIGNALGAAGGIQVGCAALGIKHSMICPTVNWRRPDPSCSLNLSATSRSLATSTTLVTGRDLSGVLSCLLLKR